MRLNLQLVNIDLSNNQRYTFSADLRPEDMHQDFVHQVHSPDLIKF